MERSSKDLPAEASRLYTIDHAGRVEKCDDVAAWHHAMRHTVVLFRETRIGRSVVVTGFTGIDLRKEGDDGPPIVFATFVGPEGPIRRYRSGRDALKGHEETVTALRRALNVEPVEIEDERRHFWPQKGDK